MTDVITQAAAVVTNVEAVVATDAAALVAGAEADIKAVVDEFVSAATKIKSVYDKLGIDLHAWDEVVALAKAL
ncbi:hypothetical protein QD357_02100 [Rhizobium sp. BR 317]|uniref:hypothetical protein n=1 Tax=Rhizobium sp. BR 317 TaxID=3040015 RepID=UPI0039BEED8A